MWTVADVLEGCQGNLKGISPSSTIFEGFSIDTRTICAKEIFIALSGPNFDGHDFVESALQKGGCGAIVARSVFHKRQSAWLPFQKKYLFILVDDPLTALQSLAAWHRKRFHLPIIGISGSNGKTTTKEMIASILENQGPVLKNEGNLNNHIGLPLTLLRLKKQHQTAVVEMGISRRGEMETLCKMARPTIGLITNIGSAHLEGLGSLEGISEEKGLLFQTIQEYGGTTVINLDDPFLRPWKGIFPDAWTFGLDENADLSAENIRQKNNGTTFKLCRKREDRQGNDPVEVTLPVPGQHQVMNALAAAAVTSALGVKLETISERLSRFRPPAQRGEIFEADGVTILFDAYNANPASVKAALDLLILQKKGSGQKIALLGDMLELGGQSKSAHYEIGRSVAEHGIDGLIAVGESAEDLAEGARQGGMSADGISSFRDLASLSPLLRQLVQKGDMLLIKGSRGMRMERLLPLFKIGRRR